jgi:hypothetical protein
MPIFYPPPAPHIGATAPSVPRKLTPPDNTPVADNPPFNPSRLVTHAAILKSWEPGPPLPEITVGPFVQGAVSVNDAPPIGRKDYMAAILKAWEDPRYAPLWGGVIVTDNTVVSDNPPFGLDLQPMYSIIAAWNVPDVAQLPPRQLPQANMVTPDNPPFGSTVQRLLSIILRAWETPPPLPTIPETVTTAAIVVRQDNPPFGINLARTLSAILKAWEAPAPMAPRLEPKRTESGIAAPSSATRVITKRWYRNSSATIASVAPPHDNPPFTNALRVATLALIARRGNLGRRCPRSRRDRSCRAASRSTTIRRLQTPGRA